MYKPYHSNKPSALRQGKDEWSGEIFRKSVYTEYVEVWIKLPGARQMMIKVLNDK